MGDTLPDSYDRIIEMANAVKKEPRQMRPLRDGYTPNKMDVICARGKNAVLHPGNKLFRSLVESKLEVYSKADTKLEKGAIVTEVLAFMRQKSPEGGFVRFVNNRWMEVGDLIAREKTGQMFRDCLHTQYKSSTKAKNQQRKQKWKSNGGSGEDCKVPDSNKRPALSEVNHHGMDISGNTIANSQSDHDIVLNKPESRVETALWSAMDEILPPADPDALHALSLIQLHLIRRLSLENQESERS